MAGVVTTGSPRVLVLVAILVCITISTEALKSTPKPGPRRPSTTARTNTKTTVNVPSTTTLQLPSTTTIQTPSTTTVQIPRKKDSLPRARDVIRGSSQLEWTAKTFPNPQLQPAACSRGTTRSWVCDPNAVLNKRQADSIDTMLSRQSTSGRCQCGKKKCAKSPSHKGIQGAVAIVNKMYILDSNPTSKELRKEAEDFAEYLRDKAWEYELCNDDYVIFISVKDRQVFTATGENARPILNDTCIKMVYEEARSKLSKRDFGNALELMVRKYTDVLRMQHPCNRPRTKSKGPATTGGIIGGIAAFLGLICCCGLCCYCCKKQKGDSAAADTDPAEEHHMYNPEPDYNHEKRRGSSDSGGAGGGF